jgi:hypothetical protein
MADIDCSNGLQTAGLATQDEGTANGLNGHRMHGVLPPPAASSRCDADCGPDLADGVMLARRVFSCHGNHIHTGTSQATAGVAGAPRESRASGG